EFSQADRVAVNAEHERDRVFVAWREGCDLRLGWDRALWRSLVQSPRWLKATPRKRARVRSPRWWSREHYALPHGIERHVFCPFNPRLIPSGLCATGSIVSTAASRSPASAVLSSRAEPCTGHGPWFRRGRIVSGYGRLD